LSSECVACTLHEGAFNVCLGGRGSRTAPFMIVGGAPTPEDDLAGKVFTSKGGKLLIELLKEAGFKGEEVFLTNSVRCPETHDDYADGSVDACREHLAAEIRGVSPTAIIALGDIALQALCKTSGISGKRGKSLPLHATFDKPELEVWPVYHPAFILKNPNYRQVVIEDLRRVRNSFTAPENIPYTVNETIQGNPEFISFDIETDFDHTTKLGGNNVTQSAFSYRDLEGTIRSVVLSREPWGSPVQWCLAPSGSPVTLVTHNGWAFDLLRLGYPAIGRDTMCLAWLDDETQPKSLDALASRYCGAISWKSDKTALLGSEEFRHYNARDAYWTLRVHESLASRLGLRVRIADRIILPAFNALQACSKRGIYINQAKVDEFMAQFTAEKRDGIAELQEFVGDISPWCRNKKGELAYKKRTLLNPASPAQISQYFIKERIVTRYTDSGQLSSDAKALETAELPEGFREPLEKYRHASKMLSTYLEPLKKLGPDGRIHPEYYMFPRVFAGGKEGGGTASGRPTASDNALTLPREFKNAGLYNAPKGKILAEADYGSVEFRLCAWYAKAEAILENYRFDPDWDAHSWFARPFYNMDADAVVEKSKRQVAKSANFSLWFCGYWKTMQDYAAKLGIKLPEADCRRAYNTWHERVPEAKPWWASVKQFVQEHGYIETPTGRRRNFGKWEYIPRDMQEGVVREAVNMLSQSFSSDLTYLALANCHEQGLPINHTWYDAVYVELDEDADRPAFEAQMHDCMISKPLATLRDEFGVVLDVPLTIEVTYRSLGD